MLVEKMEKQLLERLVKETNQFFALDDFKSKINMIAENVKKINKLTEHLGLKAYLRINDVNFKELKELV